MKLIDKNKEVDLEKEIEAWEDSFKHCPASMKYKETAKHFFELGLQASNQLTWKDIANINDIISEILKECKDKILYDTQESFCKEVLKRFKALKGEKI